ncbi:hypothetical protein YC2023_015313 [Brassica napus]
MVYLRVLGKALEEFVAGSSWDNSLPLKHDLKATAIDAPQQKTNPARPATEGETKQRKGEMKGGGRLRRADANVRRWPEQHALRSESLTREKKGEEREQ